ncbi:unnamed protein product [Schistocephalus solidus]|uniref:C2H2-type domain-containing protein n=1 Tax=Schistocephalus solidus TaxID=70667 RepID=A0A183T870_SCHSO|nr:unnamed protein product [Schistocephalus solidus]
MERPRCEDGQRTVTQMTLLWRYPYGFSSKRRSSTTLQGHFEYFPEATSNQPADLGGPRPEPTGLEKDGKDRGSNLRSQQDRRRQDQKSGMKVTSTPDVHPQCQGPSNMHALSTHLPCANRPAATTTTISDGDSLLNCPSCDRTLTSRIGLVGHLRIHRTETDEHLERLERQHRAEISASISLTVFAHSHIT